MQIKKMSQHDIQNVAKFISKMNQVEISHIGYCGVIQEKIRDSLEDLEIPFWESFIVAYENNNLVGVLGFDADLENKSVEVWGPFIKRSHWDISTDMWNEMLELLPDIIEDIYLFLNKKNASCIRFADELGFQLKSEQSILEIKKSYTEDLKKESVLELTKEHYVDFINLHNEVFPGTYYEGSQIIDRQNKHRKVFITKEHEDLSGYIYVEANPEFGEANIEFFAVKKKYRGKGIGGKLLTMALQWLFTFESINSITLCVNSAKHNAIRLYKKVGFEHVHDLCFLVRKSNRNW